MQDFLFSTEAVTSAARKGLILKFKSVARRRLVRAGVSREEMQQRLHEEMQRFAAATDQEEFATDFNASFHSVATSRLNQTARSLYYQEEVSEDEVEIVLDSSPPRMAVSATPDVVSSPPPPTYSPLAASSSQEMPPTISVVSPFFLGCSSPPDPDRGNFSEAVNNNNNSDSFADTAPLNNPGDVFSDSRLTYGRYR